MLFPAPYEVPEKKAKKTAAGTREGLRCKVLSDMTSEDTKTQSSSEDDDVEEDIPPPTRGRKKRKATLQGKPKVSKKGKTFLPDHSTAATYSSEEWEPRVKPLAKS